MWQDNGTFLVHTECLPDAEMKSVKELYWRYSLFVLILGLGATIFIEMTPFLGGILGAATIYVLLRSQMRYLTQCRKWRRSLAASLLLAEAILCFLVPISLIVWMFVSKIQDVTLDPQSLVRPIRHVAELIHEKTGYNPLQEENLSSFISLIPKVGQWLVKSIMSFSINIIILLFVLYFMLIGGHRMEKYCRDIMPFNAETSRSVMREIHMIVRSNAIGIPLIAVIQGAVAFIGYILFGVQSALFWSVLTSFATIIPIVGTALIWFPLAIYLAMTDNWGGAIGLMFYGVVVVTHVDNVVRFIMQKRMADTHPLVTIFGVIIGLSLFGFMGVIFGPLLLAIFIFCVHIFKKKYLDETSDIHLFVSDEEPPAPSSEILT